jgi:hypothetical protein
MSWHSKSFIAIGAAGIAAAAVLVAIVTLTYGQSEESEPISPGLAHKETEAARPTATPVPPVADCPADARACELAEELLQAARSADVDRIVGSARPVSRQCPDDPSVAWKPLCTGGEEKAGYFVGVWAKSFQFVSRDDLREFVALRLEQPSGQPRIASIGCPGGDAERRNCSDYFALVYRVEPQPGADEVLVLIFGRDGGSDALIGARSWAGSTAPAVGGPEDMTQEGAPFGGAWYFVPWRP